MPYAKTARKNKRAGEYKVRKPRNFKRLQIEIKQLDQEMYSAIERDK